MWFRRKPTCPFNVAELPRLDLSAGRVNVPIHHLANEAHTDAFIAIFERLIRDNEELLRGFSITAVEAKRPLASPPPSLTPPADIDHLVADPRSAARALYFSANDEVVLTLVRSEELKSLLIRFDDPHFWLW